MSKLALQVLYEASEDGRTGLLGLARGTIQITIDCPMASHGRNACVGLEVEDADAYFDEWSEKVAMLRIAMLDRRPALRHTASRLSDALHAAWPDLTPLPLYPAFRE